MKEPKVFGSMPLSENKNLSNLPQSQPYVNNDPIFYSYSKNSANKENLLKRTVATNNLHSDHKTLVKRPALAYLDPKLVGTAKKPPR